MIHNEILKERSMHPNFKRTEKESIIQQTEGYQKTEEPTGHPACFVCGETT